MAIIEDVISYSNHVSKMGLLSFQSSELTTQLSNEILCTTVMVYERY